MLTLVDDALKANHREQTAAHSCARNQNEDNYSKQASSIWAARLLQELAFLCSSHGEKKVDNEKEGVVARKAASRSSWRAIMLQVSSRTANRR